MTVAQKGAAMISYQWYLSPAQPFNKDELYKLQCCLYAAGVFLDLSWKDSSPVLTISAPEPASGNRSELPMEEDSPDDGGPINASSEEPAPYILPAKRGRPSVRPENDMTFGHVQHLRIMGVPVEAIAKEIGVSRRTFYRKWTQAQGLGPAPETPFSQWTAP